MYINMRVQPTSCSQNCFMFAHQTRMVHVVNLEDQSTSSDRLDLKTLVMVLDWKVGRPCRTTGNWMMTRCGIYVVSTLRSRSILTGSTPSSNQDAKSTSLQCYQYLLANKRGNSCWWRIISCCKNCQQIGNLTCSWELQGTSLFRTMGIPRTTRWRLNNIVGSGPCKLG